MRVLLECAVRGLADQGVAWSSQHIGNLLWALATLQERPPAALAKAVATRMDFAEEHFKPQEVANALWGWASLGLSGASLAVIRWTQHALRLASSFKPQDIANVLWALGQLQHYPGRELLEALCERIVSQADHFNAQDVANSLSSSGCLEVTPRPLHSFRSARRPAALRRKCQHSTWLPPSGPSRRWVHLRAPKSFGRASAGTALHCTTRFRAAASRQSPRRLGNA